jgi:ribose transport system substrate-binding protein
MRFRRTLVFGCVVVATSALSACGSSSSSSQTTTSSSGSASAAASTGSASTASTSAGAIKINVGTRVLSFPAGTKPKIGYFGASGNAIQTAQRNAVLALKAKGVDITYINDATFSPTTQLQELQDALQSKQYNAWIVENYGGDVICNMVSKQAPAANIVVVQQINPSCGNTATQPAGVKYWTPGTLATVGGEATVDYYTGFVKEAKAMFPPNPVVGVINGPPLVASTVNLSAAIKDNGITPVANVDSDYTTPGGLKTMQNMLQAHPNINALISIYGDSTIGAIEAIQAAGKTGKVKLFDIGGSKQITAEIAAGKQTMSVPYFLFPKADVQTIESAFAGKTVPRFVPALSVGSVSEPFAITKQTLSKYTPGY